MMSPTHALAGATAAALLARGSPEFALVAALAAFAGGVFPDLDVAWTHRRTLHFPVYFSAAAVAALALAVLVPTVLTVSVAAFLGGAALHAVSDVFGGGLSLRPWEGTSDRAVYNHARGRWHAPRRWVRYDGSPEDLVVTSLLALPVAVLVPETTPLVVATVAVAAVYALIRKPMVAIAERHEERLPDPVRSRLL